MGVGAASAALVVFHGMLVAALAGRLSWAVPLLAPTPRAIVAHAPLLSVQPGYPELQPCPTSAGAGGRADAR